MRRRTSHHRRPAVVAAQRVGVVGLAPLHIALVCPLRRLRELEALQVDEDDRDLADLGEDVGAAHLQEVRVGWGV